MALEMSDLQVKGLQGPSFYENLINSDYVVEGYEGTLAGVLVDLPKGMTE